MAERPTLQNGSVGHYVDDWQTFLGIPATGIFDTETEQATQDFQTKFGMEPNGVVSSAEWSRAHTLSFGKEGSWYESTFGAEQGVTAQSRGTATPADLNAYKVALNAAPNITENERQYVLAVARGEGYYGLGWKAGQGAGSHNWGAVQGQGPAGSFMHLDHHADGTPYYSPFKAYNTDEEGFNDMKRIILKPNVKEALAKGSLRKAVFAQHDNRYFELAPEKYLSAVLKNYNRLADAGVFKRLLSEHGGTIAAASGLVIMAGGVGLGFLGRFLWRKYAGG